MLREGLCAAGCGAKIELRTTPNVYCMPCRKAGRRANVLRAMEKQRRKNGVEQTKGTTIRCEGCGVECARGTVRRRYCNSCGSQIWRINLHKSLNLRIGNLIRAGIASGSKRKRRWESLVGYTLADLMKHLERQFLPGMSWENRSEWHIDHILPLASFSFQTPDDPEFKAAWALTNLRPLWALDNIKKNATRTHLI